jgi:UDP-4-amino-4,6-dideoxy-N-acetyl-beta-L-altrosamine N-acetyltransferase
MTLGMMTGGMMPGGGPAALMLEPFGPGNADLVLAWRNAPRVREMSLDGAEITPDAHRRFLQDLRARTDAHYWVVRLAGRPEAVLNLALGTDAARWGCQIGAADAPRPGLFPLLALLAGCLVFDGLALAALDSDVLARNTAPQRLNAHLGLEPRASRIVTGGPNAGQRVLEYRLDRADWPRVQDRARPLLPRQLRAALDGFDPDAPFRPAPPDRR